MLCSIILIDIYAQKKASNGLGVDLKLCDGEILGQVKGGGEGGHN